MKLSSIVELRNLLTALAEDTNYKRVLDEYIYQLNHILELYPIQGGGSRKNLQRVCNEATAALQQIPGPIIDIVDNINQLAAPLEKNLYRKSTEIFLSHENKYNNDQLLARRPKIDDAVFKNLKIRIKNYSSWKYAGLIIRPGLFDFINQVVDCDPMYIVDHSMDLLTTATQKFPKLYQTRLRPLTVDDYADPPYLRLVPEAQIGFCLAFYFFNFKPIDVIKQYFREIFIKLKPGGYFVFTYNNCDYSHAVALIENNYGSYTTSSDILTLLTEIGFEVLYQQNDKFELAWVECKKPGEFVSLRGGQVLAKITQMPTPLLPESNNIIDTTTPVVYNKRYVILLREAAIVMNIDTEDKIYHAYSIEKLEELVKQKQAMLNLTDEALENLIRKKDKK